MDPAELDELELLQALMEEEGLAAAAPQAIPRRGLERAPASYQQRQLWFLHRLEPASPAYNLTAAFRLEGPVAPAAFVQALEEMTARHQVLRTRFHEVEGEPWQVVEPRVRPELEVVDGWGRGRARADERALRELIHGLAARPFDLARAPLLRCRLARLGEERWLLVVSFHHVVADGWSMGVFFSELARLYQAAVAGRPAALPELPLQYSDYAAWQRESLEGEALASELAWWRRRLADLPPLDLPGDRPAPAEPTSRGVAHRFSLPRGDVAALRRLAAAEGASPFMALLAAFGALLARTAGQEELAVGTPVAGRGRPEMAGLVGYFVNTLALPLDASEDPTFRQLLGRVRESCLEAFEHQEVPFERVVEALHPRREPGRTPLFNVLFVLQDAGGEAVELPGLRFEPLEVVGEGAKLDLSLVVSDGEADLPVYLEVRTDLFDATTAARLGRRLVGLVEAAAAAPDRPLSALPTATAVERQQLREWNDTEMDHPWRGRSVGELFGQRAERFPEVVAVVAEEEALSYRQVAARAGRLAGRLGALGLGLEELVGVYADRSLELPSVVMGVLLAGGVYLPLDPDAPPLRLAAILAEARPATVLAQEPLAGRLPEHGGATLVLPVAAAEATAGPPVASPSPRSVPADALAYVLFTSGSTGIPKGAMNTHRGIVNRLGWWRGAYHLGPGDRLLQKTPLGFDVSIWELLGTLMAGATLVVAMPGRQRDPASLVRTVVRRRVTAMHSVPSMLGAFLETPGVEECTSLQLFNAGGEAMPGHLPRRFRKRLPGVPLDNLYGPSEAAVDVTRRRCGLEPEGGIVPIGRPGWNVQVEVLDPWGAPAPAGVRGELCLAGVQVGRGYVRRPGLTAERFVPAPSGPSGGRLYRTGDLVRFQPDGDLEFLGRIDHQVKVRGVRIELGEVEAILLAAPGVVEAAVVARREVAGETQIVAYLVPAAGVEEATLVDAVRRSARERLSEAMLPGVFARVEELPRLPSGKVDRRALAARETAPTTFPPGTYRPPRQPVEELLCQIFGEVLERERVGIDDDFFALGGHSLAAVRVVARVGRHLGVELPLRRLFEAPTVAALAPLITGLIAGGEGVEAAPIPPVPRDRPLPLSFAQERLWFLSLLEPDSPVYNMSLLMRFRGRLAPEEVQRCLDAVLDRHETLRTVFTEEEGEGRQVILPPGPFPVEREDWREDGRYRPPAEQAAAIQALARERARRPFDLAVGPPARGALVRLGDNEHLLLLEMHHIVSDGWSMGVLFRELVTLYRTDRREETDAEPATGALPELPLQYADFAAWQRRPERRERLEAQKAYWIEQLDEVPSVADRLADRPRPAQPTFAGAHESFTLGPELRDRLAALARRRGSTLFMTLLTAFKALLWRYTGEGDLAVGTPVAGRPRPELEGLIGFFVNTLVLRTRLAGSLPFQQALERVRETALAAYAHQEIPFEAVVEAVQPVREPARHPLFQILFAFQNAPREVMELPGLEVTLEEVETGISKFDLSLLMAEGPDGLAGTLEYSTELFDRATLRSLAGHFRRLLEAAVVEPDRPLSRLSPLSPEEESQLLADSRGAELAPGEGTVLTPFLRRVEERPDAPAVRAPDGELSYGELARHGRVLAAELKRRGVGPGTPVLLSAEPCRAQLVGLVGILLAGGAYVPADPTWPGERLALLRADCHAPCAVASKAQASHLAELGMEVVVADRPVGSDPATAEDPSPPERSGGQPYDKGQDAGVAGGGALVPVAPPDPAYVIYTSGSTGRPKGVQISHASLLASTAARAAYYPEPVGAYLLTSPVAFDSSVAGIFWTLAQGGTLVLPPEEARRDPAELWRRVRRHRVTHLLTLPSLHNLLLDEIEPGEEIPLRVLIVAGEACPRALVDKHRARLPATALYNEYGPTEGTVWATAARLDGGEGPGPVPIGGPIPGGQSLILGPDLALLPAGRVGELHLGGPGLARGYLHRPALTAERFLPHPWAATPGERLYRTGDLTRRPAGGEIAFLGRADGQVKLRGFRVEPGEVESVLLGHEEVREAAVVVRRDGAGEGRLVAYAVLHGEAGGEEGAATAAALRHWLAGRLPAFLVPAAVVLLPALPLTATGKVDLRALPEPERATGDQRPPRDAVEARMTRLWEEILEVEPVGIHDRFFDLGGHSLLAVRLMAELRRRFGRAVPLARLFAGATPAELAAEVRAQVREAPFTPLVPLQTRGEGKPLFCVHQAGGNVLEYFALARLLAAEGPCYGLQARGLDGRQEPYRTVEEMADCYVQAVREVDPQGPYHLLGHSLGGKVAFEMARQLTRAGAEVGLLAVVDVPGTGAEGQDFTPVDDAGALAHIARQIGDFYGLDLGLGEEALRALDPDARFHRLADRLAEADLAAEGMDRRDLEGMLAVYKANMEAIQAFRPGSWDGPVTVLATGGLIDEHSGNPTLGWGSLTTGPVTLHPLPGNHFNVLREGQVEALAELLGSLLANS